MPLSHINYSEIIDRSMRHAVREVLTIVARDGLPDEHHFFISFRTDYHGVQISEALRSRHPESITIVLQYQFWDLKVEENRFSVVLSFNNVPEKLVVPFAALTAFADPSVKFGLQFHAPSEDEEEDDLFDDEAMDDQDLLPPLGLPSSKPMTALPKSGKGDEAKKDDDGNKVIALDAFRKK